MAVGDAYVFPVCLTPVLLFFPKPPTTFLTCFCRGERRKYAGNKSRLNRGSNSQPPGRQSDELTTELPGRGGCPSERRHQKTVSCYGDSARIQDQTTGSLTCSVYSTMTRDLGSNFKVSSVRQIVLVRLTNPGIEPTTSSFQVEC